MKKFEEDILCLFDDFKNANKINEENLIKILSDNKDTKYGLKYDFKNIKTIKEYQNNVPLSDYNDYLPINEYKYDVGYHLATSGTLGKQKKFTVSKESMNRSKAYNFIIPFYLLNLDTSKGLNISLFKDPKKETLLSSALYDTFYKLGYYKLSDYYDHDFLFGKTNPYISYIKLYIGLAYKDITHIDAIFIYDTLNVFNYLKNNYKMLINDIKNKKVSVPLDKESINKLLKVNYTKERIFEIESILDGDFSKPVIKLLFPNLKFISGVGGGKFKIYDEAIKKFINDTPLYYFIYAQTEATMGVPLRLNEPIFTLMPKTCFYEFLDLENNDIVLSNDLILNHHYEIIVTTFSGVYRYHCGDKVKFVGYEFQSPSFEIEGRLNNVINIAGEKVDDADIILTLEKLSNKYSFGLFCVGIDNSIFPNRYVLFIDSFDNLESLIIDFDNILKEMAYDYYDLRNLNSIGMPIIKKIEKEKFESLQKGQIKPKVIINEKLTKEWLK